MRLSIVFAALIIVGNVQAQSGYKLDFKIKGWKDTTVYLGYYQGELTYLRDTARAKSGEFHFDNPKPLQQGVYFLVLNNSKVFDFVVSQDQHFGLQADAADLIKTMAVTGDEDNKLFFENMRYNMEQGKKAEPLLKIIRDSTITEEKKKEAREAFSKINTEVLAHQNEVIKNHPTTLSARWLMANQNIEVPPPPKKADGSIDSTFQLRYYREHFFDKFDLADDALIRLPRPVYQEKIKEYLSKLYAPMPDSVMKGIDFMIARAKKNPDTYRYLVSNCTFLYQNPEIMGLDEVYVRMYDKYFASGEMDYWANAALKKTVKDYADKLRPSLVGKTGSNLIMQDQNLQPRSMYDIKNKYTILWIFDPECSHCKQETPKLVDFYNKNKAKFDVEVFAVSSDTSLVKMKTFIKEMKMPWITVNGPRSYMPQHYSKFYYAEQTPSLYILDRSHKIIAKKLPVKQLEEFFTQHEKFLQQKKNGP